jgi:hypothetical protein
MKLVDYGKISWVYFCKNEKRTRRLYKGHINTEDIYLENTEDIYLEYELQGIVWETHGRLIKIIYPKKPMYK